MENRSHLVKFKIILITLFAISLINLFFNSISAEIIYVDDSGGADFTIIQDAIDAANISDTIEVSSGTYNENILINKTLSITGDGSSNTYLIGAESNKNAVKITADNVTLSGFSIDNNNGKNAHYHSIFLQNVQDYMISNNIVKNGENGIYLINSINGKIEENIIQNNNQKGIRLSSGSDGNIIYNNDIQLNGDGMYITGSDSNEIFENDILNNGYGLYFASSDGNIIYKNDFDDNSAGNAYDAGSNTWSKNDQGNYWDDYNDYDSDEDGIGDSAYEIEGGTEDVFPLGDFLTLNQVPTAYIDSISPSPSIEDETVYFNGHGTDDGTIVQWEWKSSIDGVFGTSAECSTSSLSVGTHTIKFRVYDDDSQWSNYAQETLIINEDETPPDNNKPVATIVTVSPTEIDEGEVVFFHGYGTDEDGSVTAYKWESSIDGILSTNTTFNSTILSVGSHVISFKVKDNEDAWSNVKTKTVLVSEIDNIAPVAVAGGPYSGIVNTSIVLDASDSYDSDGEIVKYSWSFGDGTVGTGKIITHIYNMEGNYTVALTVKDDEGKTKVNKTKVIITLNAPNDNGDNGSNNNGSSSDTTPGFEFLLLILSIALIFVLMKKR